MSNPITGDRVKQTAEAEHIGPDYTGDNISAKKVANYAWNSTTNEWERTSPNTSKISTLNSTDVQLGINQTFTGTWEDVTNYAEVIVTVYTTHTSITDGLKVEWSMNGTDVQGSDVFTITAQSSRTFSFPAQTKYFRVRYTNDGVATTTFQLQSVLKIRASKGSSHRLKDNLNQEDDAIVTKSQIVGFTTGGGGGTDLINVKVTPSGALTTDTTISGNVSTRPAVVTERYDYDDPTTIYTATAPVGTADSSLGWTIFKYDLSDKNDSSGKVATDVSWNNRATGSFA